MFTKNLFKISMMLVVLTIVLGISAFAQTIYVSATNGDDTFGAGTELNPYSSIGKAISIAASGSTISIQAGTYQATTVRPAQTPGTGEDVLAVTGSKSLTFVSTVLGVDSTVTIVNGININTTGTVNLGVTGNYFNLGATVNALKVTAGTLNISNKVVFGALPSTLTIGDGLMVGVPTVTNLNVTFNGANAIAATSAYLPNSIGTGVLTAAKATGALTIDNASLTCNGITISGAAAVTITGNITSKADITVSGAATVTLNGNITIGSATAAAAADIVNSNSGTVTIGSSSSNTLTMFTTVDAGTVGTAANVGEIRNTATGKIIVNSVLTENIKNTSTDGANNDLGAQVVTVPVILNTGGGAAAITLNGNVNFLNTNVLKSSTPTVNQTSHTVTISNQGAGAVSFAGTIATPASTAAFTAPPWINVVLLNQGGGTLATRGAALRGTAGTTGITNNTAAGTMTLGQTGDAFTASWDIMNDFAGSTLTLNGTGALAGALTNNNATSVVVLGADQSIAGLVTNIGKIKLNTFKLTLSKTAAAALAGAGDIYSSSTGTIGTGVVKFTGAASSATYSGNLPNVEIASGTSGSLAGNTIWGNLVTSGAGAVTIGGATNIKGDFNLTGAGVVTVNGLVTVTGNVNMTGGSITLGTAGMTVAGTFTMPQGTFTFGNQTLTLNGNFNRTAGTVVPGTGSLVFSGTMPQTFNPGTQMNVYNVTVNNTGVYVAGIVANDVITMSGSLFVLNDFTITSGLVAAGTNNIRMDGNTSARFTNGGRGYTANGIGGVIFEGSGAIGAAGTGSVITGTNAYSNIFVRLTTQTNNVRCLGAVKISGVITLDGGGITWNSADNGADLFNASTLTLDQSLTTPGYPTVVINTANTHGSPFLVNGAVNALAAPQPAFSTSCLYNLSYTGSTAATMLATDFVTGYVNNLSLVAGTGKTVQGLGVPMAIAGNLSIDALETLNLTNGGAQTLTLSGNTGAHAINGTVTGGTIAITGNNATLTGGVGTGNASSIDATSFLTVTNAAGNFTSTGMKVLGNVTINGAALVASITMNSASASIPGNFVNTNGTTGLSMNSTASSIGGNFTVTAGSVTLMMNGAAASTATITGTLAVNGGTLALGSHIWVTGTVTHDGTSVISLGNFNLTLADNYTHNNTATFQAGTGAVIATVTATKTYTLTTTVAIPNFTLNSPGFGIALATNGMTVSNAFVQTAGDINLGTLPLTISGNTYSYKAGTITSGGAAGVVNFTGTATNATFEANPTIPYVAINSTGTITIKSSSSSTARIITISQLLTQTKGTLALGANDIAFSGGTGFAFIAGSITASSSGTDLTKIGELVFSGATGFTPGAAKSLTIPNLRIDAATAVAGADSFYVDSKLTFGTGTLTCAANRMILNNGVLITRVSTGTLSAAPKFAGVVDVTYMTAGTTTGVELPNTGTTVRDLTISIATTLGDSVKVNRTLTLGAALTNTTSKNVTLVVGGTVVVKAGGSIAVALKPQDAYSLTYNGAGSYSTANTEWPVSANISLLTVDMGTGNTLTLNATKNVGVFVLTSGNLLLASDTLTVSGMTTLTEGMLDATGGGALVAQGNVLATAATFGATVQLVFTGTADQQLATPTGGTSIGNITINKASGDNSVMITGGDLTCNGIVTFINGLVKTNATNALVLKRVSGSASQGFVRNVTTGGKSHVVGNVRQNLITSNVIAFAAHDFPVGDVVNYRPASLTFYNANVGGNTPLGVTATVSHTNTRPTGTTGLPIIGGIDASTDLARYPSFFWSIATSSSLGATTFNLGLTAAGYDSTKIDINDVALNRVKMIRRSGTATDINNSWNLQGSNYDNYVINGIPTVVNVSSTGGLLPGGAIFTYGMKSNLVVLNSIANQNLTPVIPIFKQKLASVFGGNTGTLTYSVTSSNNAIASASIVGTDTVKVTALRGGSATITVTATDIDNSRISTSFTVGSTVGILVVTNAIPNQNLTPAIPIFKQKLASVFGGNTGTLTYTAVSSNTTIASASILSPDTVKVTALRGGSATITVTATDIDNNSISTSFTVRSTVGILVVTNAIPNQNLTPAIPIFKQKLASVFGGNIGTLTYTVVSSNTTIASASILSPDTVKVTALRIGSATITVTATDIDSSISTSFTVGSTVDVEVVENLPTEFSLSQNYPNPFNPSTSIKFGLPTASNVTLKVYNILGEEVASLVNKSMPAGYNTVTFDASKLGTGVYIYRIQAGEFTQVRKMMLVK